MIAVLAAAGLTGGAIWAAVHPTEATVVQTPVATGQPNGTPPAVGDIHVTLDDDPAFTVAATPDSAAVGSVTFNVENVGTTLHNFNIVKTELASDKLPVNSDTFMVDETQLDVIKKLNDFPAGETQTVKVDLQPGKYVIFCNVAAHYGQGMHTAFSVQ
jgi:uncharacterized cupredoxin-like copper-binding protein